MDGRSRRLRLRALPLSALIALAACIAPDRCPASDPKPGPPPAIRYEIVATYPHDPRAYTQGLLVQNGQLLESTGQLGESTLREVEIATGKVLRSVALAPEEFGEGLALAGDRLVQLTWRSGRALLWDPRTFKQLGALPLEGEGWGLAFDGTQWLTSDGSERLVFRDLATFRPIRSIAVRRAGAPQFYLNELEWIDSAIWANVWMSDEIVRIDPKTGAVTGILDASGLLPPTEAARAEVLNGIAWDPAKKLLYLTGKYWPRLFALRLR